MKNLKEFKVLLSFLKEERARIVLASILLLISSLVGLTYGYLTGEAIEAITNLEIKKSLIYLGLGFFNSIVFASFVYEIGAKMFRKIEVKLTNTLGEKTYRKALNLPTNAFEVKTSGEFINRITNDADALSESFSQLLDTIVSAMGCIIILIYIFTQSWIIGAEILFFISVMIIIVRYYSPRIKKQNENIKKEHDGYTSLVTETIRGIREIKTLGIKNNIFNDLKKTISKLLKRKNEQIDIETNYSLWKSVLISFIETGTFITCAILIFYNQIGLSFFISMTYYVYRYTWIVQNINHTNKMYQRILVALSRINEILANKIFQDEQFGKTRKSNCAGFIEFDQIKFGYTKEELVLDNLNVVFEPHKKIALVGKSGQGKSTIFNLITKIYNPNSGTILLDGEDLGELDETTLRNHISIIRQEPFVFNRSIKENFKMVNPKITLSEIRKCTKLAYLDDYIMSLPKKYDTILGEGGTNLSGGQKQRLSIARVLAKKSKIILLDEATSALDNESQMYISKTINNLVKNHTVIIVAHRLSTIIDADIIYVIDNGKIAAQGIHDELIESSKIYQALYNQETN